ncbi:MAG: FHA domain-containing protein [Clostridia bacterium]|nr:FHA domain-containing protein [Clostridia bacterium]
MNKRRLLTLLLSLLILLTSVSLSSCGPSPEEAAEAAKNSVVRVLSIDRKAGRVETGLGFLAGTAGKPSNIVVTNWRVVTHDGLSDQKKVEIYVATHDFEAYGNPVTGELSVNTDEMIRCKIRDITSGDPDYAILETEIKVPDKVAAQLGSIEDAESMSTVRSFGFSDGTDGRTVHADEGFLIAEEGTVLETGCLRTRSSTNFIKHDAPIYAGCSGGPIVDGKGAVIGINTFGADDTGEGAPDTRYAVAIDHVAKKLDELGISYTSDKTSTPGWVLPVSIGGGAAITLAAAVFAIVKALKNKNRKKTGTEPLPAAPSARLVGRTGEFKDQEIIVGDDFPIGRGEGSALMFSRETKGVSRSHCRIARTDAGFTLTDSGSSYGTFLNGSKLTSGQPVSLKDGDVISLADEGQSFFFRVNG